MEASNSSPAIGKVQAFSHGAIASGLVDSHCPRLALLAERRRMAPQELPVTTELWGKRWRRPKGLGLRGAG